MNERLYRSRTDRVISGVAGGLADYLAVDPSIVRVAWVLLAIVTGGIAALVYLVMMIVVPVAPADWQPRAGGPRGRGPGGGEWTPGGWGTPPAAVAGARRRPRVAGASPRRLRVGLRRGRAPREPPPRGPPRGRPAPRTSGPSGRAPRAASRAGARPTHPCGAPRRSRPYERRRGSGNAGLVFGVILILLGAWFLLRRYIAIDSDLVWPIVVIGLGAVLIVAAMRRGTE